MDFVVTTFTYPDVCFIFTYSLREQDRRRVRRIPYAGNKADGLTVDYKKKYGEQMQAIKENYRTFDIPYNGQDKDDYVNGQGFCCNDGTPEAAQARAMVMLQIGIVKIVI